MNSGLTEKSPALNQRIQNVFHFCVFFVVRNPGEGLSVQTIIHDDCLPMRPDEPSPPDSEASDEPLPHAPDTDGVRIVRSEDLLRNRREIWIEHGNEMYRLRVTSSGKLYLTK